MAISGAEVCDVFVKKRRKMKKIMSDSTLEKLTVEISYSAELVSRDGPAPLRRNFRDSRKNRHLAASLRGCTSRLHFAARS